MRFCLAFLATVPLWGAASLVMSGPSVDVGGKTLTIPITGNTGDLSPVTGITGFTVKVGTIPMAVTSVTASGATVTITLNSMALSTETVTVTLATSPTSNLTDAGSNTPTGQTNLATTNNSTLTGALYPANYTYMWWFGTWTVLGSGAYRNCGDKYGCRWEILAHGTAVDVQLYGASTIGLSVDGGADTNVSVSSASGIWVRLYDGLTDDDHSVVIQGNAGSGASFSIANHMTAMVRVASGTPALGTPDGYGTITPVAGSSYITVDASPPMATANGNTNTAAYKNAYGGIRFKANASDIWVWYGDEGIVGPASIGLFQDGTLIDEVAHASATTYWRLARFTGLSGEHEYKLAEIGHAATQKMYAWAIMLAGTLSSQVHTPYKTVQWYGDSITNEGAATMTDSRDGEAYLTALALGMAGNKSGTPSAKIHTDLRNSAATLVVPATVNPKPPMVVTCGGVNDQNSAVAQVDFQASYNTMIDTIAAGLTAPAKIVTRGILPNSYGHADQRDTYNASMQAAVADYMAAPVAGVKVIYMSTDGWIDPATDCNDGVHPTAAGYAKIAVRQAPVLRAIYTQEWFGWIN